MGYFIEIIIDGVKNFGGEIVGGIMFAFALWLFPSLRKIFGKKDDSLAEVKEEIKEELKKVLHETLKKDNAEEENQRQLEILHQEKARKTEEARRKTELERQREEKRREEERMKAEIQRKEEERKKTEDRKAEGDSFTTEAERQFELQKKLLKEKIEQIGSKDAQAQYELGKRYDDKGNNYEAEKWYHKAAEQGHADAQYELGYMYDNNHNYLEAIKWYRKAAEQGHADALYKLGYMHEKGIGVTQDNFEAVKLYLRAAENGHAKALNILTTIECSMRRRCSNTANSNPR